MNATQLLTDPRAAAVINGRTWHIDLAFGIAALGKYLSNLDMSAAGEREESVFARIKALNTPVVVAPNGASMPFIGPGAVLRGNVPAGSILKLNLSGPMFANGDLCSWGMDDFEQAISAASDNPNVDGVFIRANTGGGESLAGQILHNAVKSSKKAVVVYADMLASAGVHGTLAADEIIASGDQTRVGSIGTFISIDKSFVDWYKENVEDVYAEGSEEKNDAWREYLAGDATKLKKTATESAEIFRTEVQKHRDLKGKAESTLKGGMFFAAEAKKRGLIDSVGTLDYAYTRLNAAIKRRKMQQ